MGDRSATLTFLAHDAASGAIKGINHSLSSMGTHAGHAGKALGGAAVDLAKIGTAAVAGGILALGAGLAYAAKQAAEEEKNIARLDAAIKANTTGRQAGTAAINAAITAGEKKAFSDDAQRASIARLVTSTKDVNEALELNALAMDLARLKGIPLADAANLVGKVHDGNVGILKRYGITLDKGATSTEALAAIQAQAAGQADAYGKTTAGSFESVQLAIDNVVEDIGAALLPVLSTAAAYFTDNLVPALQAVGAQFGQWVKDNQPLITQIGSFVSETLTGLVTFVTGTLIPKVAEMGGKFLEFAGQIVKDVGPTIVGIGTGLGDLVGIIVEKIIPTIMDFAKRVWEGGLNRVIKVAGEIISDVIGFLEDLATWITSNEAIMAALSTAGDLIGAAFGLVADAVGAAWGFLKDLGSWIGGNKALMDGLKTVAEGIGGAFRTAAQWVSDLLAGLKAVGEWLEKNGQLLDPFNNRGGGTWPPKPINLGGSSTQSLGMTPIGGTPLTPLTLASGAIVVNGSGDPEAVARSVLLALKRESLRQGIRF